MSWPLAWSELTRLARPPTVIDAVRKLRARRRDPWEAYHTVEQRLDDRVLRAVVQGQQPAT